VLQTFQQEDGCFISLVAIAEDMFLSGLSGDVNRFLISSEKSIQPFQE